MSVIDKIENKVIDLIDVHQDILSIVKQLKEENRDLKEKLHLFEQERILLNERLEKLFLMMQEVGDMVKTKDEQVPISAS